MEIPTGSYEWLQISKGETHAADLVGPAVAVTDVPISAD
jgi:hypothetical protein